MVRAVTQADVAREAGVSRQLVSLVVQNDKHVSKERRAAVLEAMERLGYRPNWAAQSLASKSTGNFGLLVPSFANPFYGEFAESFTNAVRRRGFTTSLAVSLEDEEFENKSIERFLELRVSGLAMISPKIEHTSLERIAQLMPVCLVSNNAAPSNCDLVHTKDFEAVKLATKYLASKGYENLVYLGQFRSIPGDTTHERIRGYKAAMAELGEEQRTTVILIDESVSEAARQVIEEFGPGTGVIAHNDLVAMELLMAVHDADYTPGKDIGITGFDNTRISAMPTISLSTIDQQLDLMAEKTIDLLISRGNNLRAAQQDVVIEPRLIERSSTIVR
ncbi:MAG: LacI family DNA-binding transcriptional regulator [Actinomycetaceae bacterium]|nr:LacI family DNA-binding transcriptional regulator [Actinomycetaceae bacterium]